MTNAMNDGRQTDTERRRTRVASAITAAQRAGIPMTASAIARAARVDRTFLYRHRDLLDTLHAAAQEPAGPAETGQPSPGHRFKPIWRTRVHAAPAWLRASTGSRKDCRKRSVKGSGGPPGWGHPTASPS
ncbi:hypothetical protein ACFWC9_39765 [Streptomyces goshikiensis]|uniref:hypothetical protein n=1 Tax=Streptomyces goshikiensis TaxID=1942 RepID=UPI0036745B45